MAALAIMMMLQMHLVSSQDIPDCDGSDGSAGSCEEIAALQLSSQQQPRCEWRLGTPAQTGTSCETICARGGLVCDPAKQKALTANEMATLINQLNADPCDPNDPNALATSTDDRTPYIFTADVKCRRAANGNTEVSDASSACNLGANSANFRRLCCCIQQGAVDNDPHIHTLRGAHYTLLKSGNFLAWSFSKDPVDWHLLAAYSGARSRFTTQSLLLLEKQSGQTLEMTAADCVWQRKTENGWRKVQPGLLLQAPVSLDVQEVHKHTRDPLNLESVMVLQMEPEKSGVRKVARLLTHCSPKKYLNYKVKMFETKDLDYVGGELGSAPRANQSHLSLLSAKLSSMVMQSDTEFQVGTWASLGGSEAAAEFLKVKQQAGTALLSAEKTQTCTEAEEQEAEKICAKHLPKDDDHAEVFIDCVYDVCHGGGEADAMSAAAFLSA
eukprot:s1251_g17.t1